MLSLGGRIGGVDFAATRLRGAALEVTFLGASARWTYLVEVARCNRPQPLFGCHSHRFGLVQEGSTTDPVDQPLFQNLARVTVSDPPRLLRPCLLYAQGRKI